MFKKLGNVVSLVLGFFFWGLILLFLLGLLVASLWLDTLGVEKDGVVVAKSERITFRYANWTRTFEVGLQRADGPMADLRRAMQSNKEGHPELVGVEKVRVSSVTYDGLRVGQNVKVLVHTEGFLKDWPISTQLRLAGQNTFSLLTVSYESMWPFPEFVLSLVPAALLAWLAMRTTKWIWLASAVCFLTSLAYWLSPLSDRRPVGRLAEADGKVVALRLVERIGDGTESEGFDALVPHVIVGVEFIPEGGNGPVVAVDRVDASSVDLKEGSKVRVEYQRDDPRRALLLEGERTWWWMNLLSLALWGAFLAGIVLAGWLVSRFFKGLFAGRLPT